MNQRAAKKLTKLRTTEKIRLWPQTPTLLPVFGLFTHSLHSQLFWHQFSATVCVPRIVMIMMNICIWLVGRRHTMIML